MSTFFHWFRDFCFIQGDLESRNKEHLEGKFIGDLHFTKQGMLNFVLFIIIVFSYSYRFIFNRDMQNIAFFLFCLIF